MITVEVQDAGVDAALKALQQRATNAEPLMATIAAILLSQTERNFATQNGPDGAWPAPKPATLKRRRGGGGKILQDSGRLAASVTAASTQNSASISTNVIYSAIHQFGGSIDRAPFSSWVRLGTDKRGDLLRQATGSRLVVFAKGSHKKAKTVRYTSGGYRITIPARPYLPVHPDGRLQDGTDIKVIEAINAFLADS